MQSCEDCRMKGTRSFPGTAQHAHWLVGSQHEKNCVFFVWEVQRLHCRHPSWSRTRTPAWTYSQMTFWLQRIRSDRLRINWDEREYRKAC